MRWLLTVALWTAALCLAGPVDVPLTSKVPVSLQSLFVLLPAVIFGRRIGTAVVVVFLWRGSLFGTRSGYDQHGSFMVSVITIT